MLLDEIAAYLASQGVGTPGTDLFLDWMPDEPDALATLYATPGAPPIRSLGEDVLIERPRIELQTRAAPHEAVLALARARAIYDCLKAIANRELSGVFYQTIDPAGPPVLIGRDERARPIYSAKFDVQKEES